MTSVPARYPPPWRVEDALARPSDADPIEVGILIVGAGPARSAGRRGIEQWREQHSAYH